MDEIRGGGFLFNFSKVTESALNGKTINFFHIFIDGRVSKFTITKLKYP